MTNKRMQAFSLIELSIVLVILGLITGGVLAGQSLIRAAELRGISTQTDEYRSAVNIFKAKYFSLPGDMTNATDFWGALDGADGLGADCFTLISTATATCNGNGNGWINDPAGGTGVWNWAERFTFWVHLSNAGLILGQYTGKSDSTTNAFTVTPGLNSPEGAISGSEVRIVSSDFIYGAGHTNSFAGLGMTNALEFRQNILTPTEAWSIDKKFDDGMPGTGRVYTAKSTSPFHPGCADSDDPSTAQYSLTVDDTICPIDIGL